MLTIGSQKLENHRQTIIADGWSHQKPSMVIVRSFQKTSPFHRWENKTITIPSPQKIYHRSSLFNTFTFTFKCNFLMFAWRYSKRALLLSLSFRDLNVCFGCLRSTFSIANLNVCLGYYMFTFTDLDVCLRYLRVVLSLCLLYTSPSPRD